MRRNGFPLQLSLFSVVTLLLSTGHLLWAQSTPDQKEWTTAVSAPDATRVEELIHEFALARDTKQLGVILEDHVARIPDMSSSALTAPQAEFYRALLEVGRYFVDAESLTRIGDFLHAKLGTAGAHGLFTVLITSNQSPHVILALKKIALQTKKPSHKFAKVLGQGEFSNLRLFAIEKVASVRSWAAVDLLVKVIEVEEKSAKGNPTYIMRKTASLLTQLTGQQYGALSVNWAGYLGKHRDGPFPDAEEIQETARERRTATAIDDYDDDELFAGETPGPEFVVVVGADWVKSTSRLLRSRGQITEDETQRRLLENDRKHRQMYGMSEGLIENMLKEMTIPFTKVQRDDLEDFDLSKTGVLIFKCAQFHELCICVHCSGSATSVGFRLSVCQCSVEPAVHVPWKPVLGEPAIAKIRKFVRDGGYVFGEDWTIREILERCWPKFVTAAKKKLTRKELRTPGLDRKKASDLTLKEQTIKVHVTAPGHPYVQKMFTRKMDTIEGSDDDEKPRGRTYVAHVPDVEPGSPGRGPFEWPVDDESFAAYIVQEKAVTTLLVSDEIREQTTITQERTGGRASETRSHGAVALTFAPYGKKLLKLDRRGLSIMPRKRLKGGSVLWTLGHLATQEGEEEDIYSIEYMLLNFIHESWSRGKP